jgi:hypothetical protein
MVQTREWHGLVGYLNYPVTKINWIHRRCTG